MLRNRPDIAEDRCGSTSPTVSDNSAGAGTTPLAADAPATTGGNSDFHRTDACHTMGASYSASRGSFTMTPDRRDLAHRIHELELKRRDRLLTEALEQQTAT